MYAVIAVAGRQFCVRPSEVFLTERLIPSPSKDGALGEVLLVAADGQVSIGQPTVKGAQVICHYMGPAKGPKLVHFEFRRRKNSRRKRGHRQLYDRWQVKEIKMSGKGSTHGT